jgi:flagellar protein FlbD
MILLHRLARDAAPFYLNADLVVSVEANPDTVVHLTTGANLLVRETPDEVVGAVRSWRRSVQPLLATTSSGDSP